LNETVKEVSFIVSGTNEKRSGIKGNVGKNIRGGRRGRERRSI
jgi:hypothetical protein